ncbi:DUF1641 domain-containing protein [Archaeoglobus neptunius]|uniref:DUF1641 domain-containing protein n=1 Tax=Archaeoglobus neptunius TaxID=2798580 RepID=UPI0019279AFD|nr:DUF1641 domain-containing protein [Archaeoglobus neptunius]
MSDKSDSDKIVRAAEALYEIFEKIIENHEDILNALEKLLVLERKGVLDEIVKLSELKVPISAEEVGEVAEKLETLVNLLLSVDERVLKVIKRLIDAFEESMIYEPMGIMDAMKVVRDPDVQKAIGFALTLAKNFGKRI